MNVLGFLFLVILPCVVSLEPHREWGPAWPNILDEGCQPLRRTCSNDSWSMSQVLFWYGDLYPLVLARKWQTIKQLLEKSAWRRKSSVLYRNDTSEKAVIARYGLHGTYRHWHDAYMLCDFLRHAPENHRFKSTHGFPILMQDGVLHNEVAITFSRLISPGREMAVLWPWPYHLHLAQQGTGDVVMFSKKLSKVMFRGALSGPLRHVTDFHHKLKSSRLPIIHQWHNHSWCDLGISFVPDEKKKLLDDDQELASQLDVVLKKPLSIPEMLNYKYILVIEGADISSSFGWVLASYSVPFHPYPFSFHVWYYNGLQPWIHFVPLLPDGSNLKEAFDWCEAHTAECSRIAYAGRIHMAMMLNSTVLDCVKWEVARLWDLEM